jgi:TIR domain
MMELPTQCGRPLSRRKHELESLSMATLKELFDSEHGRTLKKVGNATFAKSAAAYEIPYCLYCDFESCACFLGAYIPEEVATAELLHDILRQHQEMISSLKGRLGAYTGHVAIYQANGPVMQQLPFTGRIILYVDAKLDDSVKQSLVTLALSLGVWVQIRDRTYEDYITMNEQSLGFISHDSRDKDLFVRPLAEKLRDALCPVWYDEFSLKPGDSLTKSIDAGLHDSKKCIVILSQNFFTNPGWGRGEFNAIVNRHFSSGGNILIPIWYGVTRNEVAAFSELVTDIVAIDASIGVGKVADKLRRVLLAA